MLTHTGASLQQTEKVGYREVSTIQRWGHLHSHNNYLNLRMRISVASGSQNSGNLESSTQSTIGVHACEDGRIPEHNAL
jgi:hypothetical protein